MPKKPKRIKSKTSDEISSRKAIEKGVGGVFSHIRRVSRVRPHLKQVNPGPNLGKPPVERPGEWYHLIGISNNKL